MTTQAMTEAEIMVFTEAVQAVLESDIPGWERSLIPQATLTKAIASGVAAVDTLRDKAQASTKDGT